MCDIAKLQRLPDAKVELATYRSVPMDDGTPRRLRRTSCRAGISLRLSRVLPDNPARPAGPPCQDCKRTTRRVRVRSGRLLLCSECGRARARVAGNDMKAEDIAQATNRALIGNEFTVTLPPTAFEAIARRVLELLAEEGRANIPTSPPEFLNVDEAAEYLRSDRQRSYDHSSQRGGYPSIRTTLDCSSAAPT